MAVDLRRHRLFVAELGNDSVDAIDLGSGTLLHRFTGLKSPQGVAYVPGADVIVVANAGDGTVMFFGGGDFAALGNLNLGDDADNIRVDPRSGHVVVGYGEGGLAVIDLAAGRQIASWTVPGLAQNFPMALDNSGATIATVFRSPPRLVFLDSRTGAVTGSDLTCADADDVFFDAKRQRVYVSCVAGAVDVFSSDSSGSRHIAHIHTSSGARTSLFVPELDELYVAERAGLVEDAAIAVFRPAP